VIKLINAQTIELVFAEKIKSEKCIDGQPKYNVSNSILYEWVFTHWKSIEDDELIKIAWDWIAENHKHLAKPKNAESCAKAAKLSCDQLPSHNRSLLIVPCKNCYLIFDERGEFKVELPKRSFGITYILSCDYLVEEEAPLFVNFLNQVLPEEDVRIFLQEFIGYTLMPDCRFEKAIFMHGNGSNGKSTFAKIVSQLHEKTVSLDLDNLSGFGLSPIIGASLIFIDETPGKVNEQALKKIISGNLIKIDRKYKESLHYCPTAKLLILGNNFPTINDLSNGVWRRLTIVNFTQNFAGSDADPQLVDKIVNKELSGILNWSLSGLISLIRRGHFSDIPAGSIEAIEVEKKASNPVLQWVEENEIRIIDDMKSFTKKDDVYQSFSVWCQSNGFRAINSVNFFKQLKDKIGVFETRQEGPIRKRYVNVFIPELE